MKLLTWIGKALPTVLLVVLAVLGARWMWRRNEAEPWTRDGRVRADIVQVAPDVSGLATQIEVRDDQAVRRGQTLFVIDRPRFELALMQAKGAQAASEATLAQAEREDRRDHALGDLVPTETTEENAAKVQQLRAALTQAIAARNLAALNLQRTTVVAPVDGVVTNMEMRPGDYLTAGRAAMALVYGGSLHVDGYFEETKLPAVRIGDPARVELMGVANPIMGHVESIAGGVEDRERGASGDLLANINPTFSWVRLPQRIPVRIAIDKVPPGVRLIPGSTATVVVLPRDAPAPYAKELPVVSRHAPVLPALMASGLIACTTVGPDYQRPRQALIAAPAAQGAFRTAPAGAVTQAEPPDHWWRLYDDPKLDALVEQALAANSDLKVAAANLERSQSLLAAADAARRPDVVLGGGASESERSAEAYVHAGPIPIGSLYDAGVAVSYDLDLFGRLKRGVEAARNETEAVQAARDLARVNVAAQTVGAYAEVCNAGAELAATERLVQIQSQAASLVQRLARGGREILVNASRQEQQADQLRATTPALKARQTLALLKLATLAGRPPETFDPPLADCRTSLQISSPLPVGDGAALLRRRPDVRAAERRLAEATAQIGVETAALYPTVQLGASIGTTGAIKDFDSPLTHRFSVGPLISWRLNQSVPRARIAAADAEAKAALARFDVVVLAALQETESALTVYARDLDRQDELEASRGHALKLAQSAHQLQAGGRMGAIAALDADRVVAVADQSLAVNRSQISQDQIAVFLSLGGGWRP